MAHHTSTAAAKRAADRSAQALNLRLAGHTYRQIATALGYSGPGSAHKAVTRALDAIPAPAAHEYQRLQLARAEALHQALWPKALDGDVQAVRALDRLWASLDRYHGFDPARASTADGTERVRTMIECLLDES